MTKYDLIRICSELSEEVSTYEKENNTVDMLMAATITDMLDLIATIKTVKGEN